MRTHFTDNYILNPSHRITVDVIGGGGTGSQVVGALARMDYALFKLGHPGFQVRVFDGDIVTEANIGRQLFSLNDIGQFKSAVLVSRINGFYGNAWEAVCKAYPVDSESTANITISCVDNIASRINIGKSLRDSARCNYRDTARPIYWLDFGNQTDRGQVILGTISKIAQPKSKKGVVAVSLPCVDEVFDLTKVDETESGPSCSLAEALSKQDLFVNSLLTQVGCALLWKLCYEGSITTRGAFVNLSNLHVNPIKV